MIELDIKGDIDAKMISKAEESEVEQLLEEAISEGIAKQVKIHLDEMAFIDLELDETRGVFHYKAAIVLCSKQDIISNAQQMAQKLAEYGLGEDEILDILQTQTQDNGGF